MFDLQTILVYNVSRYGILVSIKLGNKIQLIIINDLTGFCHEIQSCLS